MILSEEGFNKFFDNPLGCQEDRLKVFRDGFRRDSALCGSSLLFSLSFSLFLYFSAIHRWILREAAIVSEGGLVRHKKRNWYRECIIAEK